MERKQLCMAVCDDRPEDMERIREAVQRTMETLGYKDTYGIHCFATGSGLYEAARKGQFHLVLLDIEMPGMDGFELATKLRMDAPGTYLVFVSDYEQFVFDSYEYAPLWFVRKSSLEQDLGRAMHKYMQKASWMRLTCRVNGSHGFREVEIGDILYVEYAKHTLLFWMAQGECLKRYGTLRSVEEELAPCGFLRVHKNYLVNQKYVQKVDRREVQLMGGIRVDMGRDRRRSVREAMIRYEGRERDG